LLADAGSSAALSAADFSLRGCDRPQVQAPSHDIIISFAKLRQRII
jgi:hypothetical protein